MPIAWATRRRSLCRASDQKPGVEVDWCLSGGLRGLDIFLRI